MSVRDLYWLTPEVRRVQAEHRKRFDRLYGGDPLPHVPSVAGRLYGGSHPLTGGNEIDMLREPDAWLDDVLRDMRAHIDEASDPLTFRPLSIELDALGVHFIDAILGAQVYVRGGQVWSDPLPYDLSELSMPDLSRSQVLHDALHLAERAAGVSQAELLIALPVFSCAINIGINLFGERLLLALADRPEVAKESLARINRVILHCVHAFRNVVPAEIMRNSVAGTRYAPVDFGQVDGCATHLVSSSQYHTYFEELDNAVLSLWPHGGMMHLCGQHVQHIPAFKRMRSLRSLQLNDRASEDFEAYYKGLRPDQLFYVGPTATMTVDRILEISQGRRVVLQCPLQQAIQIA